MEPGTVHLVFGSQGAGKSTYARKQADSTQGVRFSIDDWMHQLYGPDVPEPFDIGWILKRVRRCEGLIWATAADVARRGGNVVLDLGFMKVADRSRFTGLAQAQGLPVEMHYVDAPHDLRRSRVMTRNIERGESFSFEVTPAMFDYMEKQFEAPTPAELSNATVFDSSQ